MKSRHYILLAFFSFLITNSFAQESKNPFDEETNKNYLRNYKAPDFKLRRLQFSFNGSANGSTTETSNSHNMSFSNGLDYYRISNQSNYQGVISTSVSPRFSISNSSGDITTAFTGIINNSTQNRFYLNDKYFFGIHDNSSFNTLSFATTIPGLPDFTSASLTLRPAISVGVGRIEIVFFARQAMDVEKLLLEGGRINSTFTTENRKILSDKIAEIQNKRFYDIRLGRIYQLEALDTALRNMGVINNYDFIYFSQLQDAFLYSNYFPRYSGMRNEIGVTQGLMFAESNASTLTRDFMSYGFYSFSYFLPQSYTVQHNFTASLIGGFSSTGVSTVTKDVPVWLDARYSLGLFPTTRTYLSASANAGLNYSNGTLGYIAGTTFDAYYYISPKFRFWANANLHYGENYVTHGFSHIATTNISRAIKEIDYSIRFGLTYDIF